METILVTGGAGFIGAYLVKRLVKLNYKVIIVDTLLDVGAISYVHPQAVFLKLDISDYKTYQILEKYNIDYVFHLAAQSAGEPSYDNPFFDSNVNAFGTLLLSKFCKENSKIKKIIYTSTVAVYGNANDGLLSEKSPIDPDSIYGVSKYSGELYVRQTLKDSNVDYTIFRVFNTYGPGENLLYGKKGMVSIYLSYVWQGSPIDVKGSLDRYRDFTYIDDTVDALILSMHSKLSNKQTYNLSSGIKTTVGELLEKIKEIFKLSKDYPVNVIEGTPGDSFGFHSDSTKIYNDLNWSPVTSLEDGLRKYNSWIAILENKKTLKNMHPFSNRF